MAPYIRVIILLWFLALAAALEAEGPKVDGPESPVDGRILGWAKPDLSFWPFAKKEVCYNYLGCFNNSYPFSSPFRRVVLLPASPEKIATQFLLYTRKNSVAEKLHTKHVKPGESLGQSYFNAYKKTKIIIHGFLDSGAKEWVTAMTGELLKYEDVNVVVVDWTNGATWPYMQAVANARLVGAQVAYLIKFLVERRNATVDQFHLIGHSIGAHVAGYVGQRVKQLPRISGLDPANVFFKDVSLEVRLDKSDALFVDVIHTDTDSYGFGLLESIGHADFYPNGGAKQPGCESRRNAIWKLLFDSDIKEVSISDIQRAFCSHQRALLYYIASINSRCPFLGHHCSSYKTFLAEECWSCSGPRGAACSPMGYHAYTAKPTVYFLKTASVAPYCEWNYKVDLRISRKQYKATKGRVFVKIGATYANLSETEITYFRPLYPGNELLIPGSTVSHVISHQKDIGQVTSVQLRFSYEVAYLERWLFSNDLHAECLTIRTINKPELVKRYTFKGTTLSPEYPVSLYPSPSGCSDRH